jgi:FkbM family methyltransferase
MDLIGIHAIGQMSRQKAENEIRARVQSIYVGNDLVLTRVLGHPKMYLHTKDAGLSAHVMMDGYWEIWLTLVLAQMLKPGMVCIDVGANFGYYSILMGFGVWPDGKVIAVEPNPPVAAVMQKSLQLNGLTGLVQLEQVAAGAVNGGSCHLFVPDGEPKNAAIVGAEFVGAGGQTVEVPLRTIDAMCAGLDRVDLVKIDAEGAEIDVLSGMRQVIATHKPKIVLEFNAARYANPTEFLDSLAPIYGRPRLIDYSGTCKRVSDDEILRQNLHVDKLLLFEA